MTVSWLAQWWLSGEIREFMGSNSTLCPSGQNILTPHGVKYRGSGGTNMTEKWLNRVLNNKMNIQKIVNNDLFKL